MSPPTPPGPTCRSPACLSRCCAHRGAGRNRRRAGRGSTARGGTAFASPLRTLDGLRHVPNSPPATARPMARRRRASSASREHPPGFYGSPDAPARREHARSQTPCSGPHRFHGAQRPYRAHRARRRRSTCALAHRGGARAVRRSIPSPCSGWAAGWFPARRAVAADSQAHRSRAVPPGCPSRPASRTPHSPPPRPRLRRCAGAPADQPEGDRRGARHPLRLCALGRRRRRRDQPRGPLRAGLLPVRRAPRSTLPNRPGSTRPATSCRSIR